MGMTDDEQYQVFMTAFDIYTERNAKYQDLWMTDGAQGCMEQARHKSLRMRHALDHLLLQEGNPEQWQANFEEDALDAINYVIFAIRNVRALRIAKSGE
jgi:hypothetical protein